MGTNYYVATNRCECCNRFDEQYHIGKSSYGWAFSFRGYKAENGYLNDLRSWKEWKEFLKDQLIANEYGEFVPYEKFVDMVEGEKYPTWVNPTNGHRNLRHNEEGRREGWFNSQYDWDDEEGFSFCSREFS